jgi:hypothetical protein
VTPLPWAESGWKPPTKRAEVRMVATGGRADDPPRLERLRTRARSIRTRCAPAEIVPQAPPWRWLHAWPDGTRDVLEAVWQRLGLPDVISEPLACRPVDLAVERARFAMGANRACAPSAKLSCDEPW